MTTLKEMREKQAKTLAEARERLDQIDSNTTEARAQELEAQFDAAMQEYDATEARISRQEKLDKAEALQKAAEERAIESKRPDADDKEVVMTGNEARDYKSVFSDAIRYGTGSLDAEERSVLNRGMSKIEEARALNTGTDSAGGYLVPTELANTIEQTMAIWGHMLDPNLVNVIRSDTGSQIEIPTLDYTAIRGGLVAEAGAVTNDGGNDPVFGQKLLNSYLYNSEIVKVSIQMLKDSAFSMESLLADLFGESLARTANDALTTADGSAKPEGIITGAAVGVTAAGTAALTSDELIDLQHSVNAAYRASPKCAFQFNDATLAYIRKLKDGDGNYLWTMGDVQKGVPASVLGHKFYVNPSMDNLGTGNKPVIFGDHSKYTTRLVGGATVFRFDEMFMANQQIGFMSYLRADGVVTNNAALKVLQNA